MRFKWLYALAVVFAGIASLGLFKLCACGAASVDRAAVSIQTVHHGRISLPAGGREPEDVTYMERGAMTQADSTTMMFRLDADGKTATLVPVLLGAISGDLIEIKEGLREGDQVIVSDMSRWSNVDRVWIE